MILTEKVEKIGKEFLVATACLAKGIEPKNPPTIIYEQAKGCSKAEINQLNLFLAMPQNFETLYLQASARANEAIMELQKSTLEAIQFATLITATLQEAEQPLIMTKKQLDAWKEKEPETEQDRLEENRAGLYGIAVLNNERGLKISPDGEYKSRDRLAAFKATYGVEAFIADTEKARAKRARHYERKQKYIENARAAIRYNLLLEEMAKASGVPELEYWKLDTGKIYKQLEQYNYIIEHLYSDILLSDLLGIAYDTKTSGNILQFFTKEACRINKDLLADFLTAKERQHLKKLAKSYYTISLQMADSFTSDQLEIGEGAVDLMAAAAEMEAE